MIFLRRTSREDSGLVDLKSLIVSSIIILAIAGMSTLASGKLLPQYHVANFKEKMVSVGAEQSSKYSLNGKYAAEAELELVPSNTKTLVGNRGGCFTIVGAVKDRGFILESGQEKPAEIAADTTAHCIGETALKHALSQLGLPTAGRTGKEVLRAPENLKTASNQLTWSPVAGATRYRVTITKNGTDQPVTTTTLTKLPYVSAAGDTLTFSVQGEASNAEAFAALYTERSEPASVIPDPGFDATNSWKGDTGKFSIVPAAGQCPGMPSTGKVAAIAPGSIIYSAPINYTNVNGKSIDTAIYLESCGTELPIVSIDNNVSNYISKFSTNDTPEQWKKRSPDLQEAPAYSNGFQVLIYNSSAETMYVDNIDIKLTR